MRMIRLQGGPADGETRPWYGGDIYRWVPYRVINFTEPCSEPEKTLATAHEYVRTRWYIDGHTIFRHRPG